MQKETPWAKRFWSKNEMQLNCREGERDITKKQVHLRKYEVNTGEDKINLVEGEINYRNSEEVIQNGWDCLT